MQVQMVPVLVEKARVETVSATPVLVENARVEVVSANPQDVSWGNVLDAVVVFGTVIVVKANVAFPESRLQRTFAAPPTGSVWVVI